MTHPNDQLQPRWASDKASVEYACGNAVSRYPLVSIITPTYSRQAFHPAIWACANNQDYPNIEWLVEDDSEGESLFLSQLCDHRLSYRHVSSRYTVGAKRNALVDRSHGEYIVHFDDDDYYAPHYVSNVVSHLVNSEADALKLSGYFIYDKRCRRAFYWDQDDSMSMRFMCKSGFPLRYLPPNPASATDHRLGFGFSYAYKREVAEQQRFADINFGEDVDFMQNVIRTHSVLFVADDIGLCCHIIHGENLSGCFPQFIIPEFIFDRLFPGARCFLTLG